jgi:hypothetical protein
LRFRPPTRVQQQVERREIAGNAHLEEAMVQQESVSVTVPGAKNPGSANAPV